MFIYKKMPFIATAFIQHTLICDTLWGSFVYFTCCYSEVYATNRQVAGSISDGVSGIFQ
jgi:hypothetical protein